MRCYIVCIIAACFATATAKSSPHIPTGGLAIAKGPPSEGDSAVHYAYQRHYDYGHHHVEPIHAIHYDYGYAHPYHVVDAHHVDLVDHYGKIHPVDIPVHHHGYGHGHEVRNERIK